METGFGIFYKNLLNATAACPVDDSIMLQRHNHIICTCQGLCKSDNSTMPIGFDMEFTVFLDELHDERGRKISYI